MNIKYNHKRVHIEHANNKYFFQLQRCLTVSI